MTKKLPNKSRVTSVSKVRKSAMMGAAATALIAAAPSFAADAPATEAAPLQTAIRNILRTPRKVPPWHEMLAATPGTPARANAISIGNDDDITVAPDATALSHAESTEDVALVNTGNLTGGIGIEVSTGANDFANSASDEIFSFTSSRNFEFLYDDAGNHILDGYGYWVDAATDETSFEFRDTILNPDPLESAISVDNSGSIAFSGLRGIKANNPAGNSIAISNSGDITSTADTATRTGIYASTESVQSIYSNTLTAPGVFTRNAYGQLTSVVTPDAFSLVNHSVDMAYDAGAIDIRNTGDIDMGVVAGYAGYGVMASVGIYTRGDGGTTVVNDGHIKVGEFSAGILTFSTATTSITNSGSIEVGNSSSGIFFEKSAGRGSAYRLGGDVYVLNTGDIVGGATKDQAEPGEYTHVRGISVFSLGTNHEGLADLAEMNQLISEYNQILGYDAFATYDIPNTHLYDTTVVNQGRIELLDGSRGILIQANAGDATAINAGTIIVGEGVTNFDGNYHDPAAGIFQSNLPVNGRGSVVSINTETGVIQTGDDGAGLTSLSYRGDATTINEGIIVTGDGVFAQVSSYYYGESYDKLFHSQGMFSGSIDYVAGTTAYARNSGRITVGDLAIGSEVTGLGYTVLDPTRSTAINVNEGIIATGDNSAGMFTRGTNATSVNTGRITTGDYDISAFHPNQYSAEKFAMSRNGVGSTGTYFSEVINTGTIITGDGKVGASAAMSYDFGYGARVIQGDTGVITTGDDSIGARVTGIHYAMFANEGGISVGDNSVGADITAGSALLYFGETTPTKFEGTLQAANAGIIETGDNSIGIRMNGDRKDVPWRGTIYSPPSPEHPYGWFEQVTGTVDLTNASYLANSGTIRVGANSTAVEITGATDNDKNLHLFNTGTIDASFGASTAIRLNADNRLDSYAVNAGTIAGDIVFGGGDDRLKNTVSVDSTGHLTHSGNIIMNGSLIDFGAGDNRFDVDRSLITIAGGDNLIAGADVFMTRGNIEARNNAIGSSLTIDGNVSGDFTFGADFDGVESDQLFITGNVADGSSMGLVLNPTKQLSGDTSFTVITIDGDNDAGTPIIAGVTGNFSDSLQDAEVHYSAATGEVTVTARFGMGHMATSASAATSMAQQWWMQSVGSLDKRDMQQLAGLHDTGLSVWATAFQEEGSLQPANDLQDVSFDQKLTGLQTGIEWKGDVGGGSFSIGPMFSYGTASANQNANLANAKADASAYGVNAGFRFGNGVYLNGAWQQMTMSIDFRTPGTSSQAIGSTDAEGDGFNLELGYAHKLNSGLTLAPQLQYASVDVDVDDFMSSDSVYALTGLTGKQSLLRAGVSLFKTFETTNGSVTPLLDLSYLNVMDGDSTLASNGIAFGNDTKGSGFRGEFGVAGRFKGWDITGRVGLAETSAIKSALSSNLTVRYRW